MGIVARIMEQPASAIAVRAGGMEISYARFCSDIDAAAAQFAAAGLEEGMVAGVRCGPAASGHSYANWVAHLAVMKLGAAHVSMTDVHAIKASTSAARIDFAIGNFESLIDVPLSVKRIQFHVDPRAPAAAVAPVGNGEAAASRLNLTSGTTGKPKLVTWDSTMMERRVDQVADAGLINSDTRYYPLLHLKTTAGFRYPLAVWAARGSVLLPLARKGLEREREALPHSNLITCSPLQLKERLVGIPGEWPGREGRAILVLGGRLPAAQREAALQRACSRLLISYGSTETGSVASGDHSVVDRHPGAVGFVREGVEVEIINPQGEPVPAGEPGLMRIRTEMMVSGYEQGSPGAVADGGQFRDGWFHPGDIGRLYDDGLLAIEGRIGDTLNLGGWKISAPALEAKAAALPGVKDVCAVTMQLPEGDMLTFGLVCDDDFEIAKFREAMDSMLSRKRRFHVIRLPSIPRNAMGKIPRPLIASQLAALYGAAKKNVANA